MKFTFKKHKGHWGYSHTDVKLKKKVVGAIRRHKKFNWRIGFTVEKGDGLDDGNPNCSWMWVFVDEGFDTEGDARKHLNENVEKYMSEYTLHALED